MKYTKEIPTKPGWYWVRDSFIKDKEIEELIGCFMYSDTNEMYFIVPGMFEAEKADGRFEYSDQSIQKPEEWEMNLQNWQPIKTAPKDGTWILAVVYGFIPTVVIWDDGIWKTHEIYHEMVKKSYVSHLSYEPTHWQPLPEGPA